ncbi:GGDEF domain-containing protein [Piscinibacter terrae]|uniref:diguanylate cyclase n=1 Tax=Piscinibacter terrae TaxID=2496871 RepID=A0A3N7JSM1_9BURK|nr:GGDEF domain-containing protein [Albitalea terrae]RQP21995.1 GGDEF domain-containing protein [Albitalea terrae]
MDLRTLFYAQTGALIATAAMLWIARAEADSRNGLRTWTFAITSQGVAYLLLASAGRLPVLLTAVLGNALGALSVALFMVAIRQFLGLRRDVRWLSLMVVAVTIVAGIGGAHYEIATMFNGVIYGAVQLLNGQVLWVRPSTGLRRIQRVVSVFYLLMGLVLPLRAAALALTGTHRDYLDLPLDWQAPVYVFGFLFIIVTNLGFVLMCKMRAEDEARRQAMTDELTGLANRRALSEAIERSLAQSVSHSRPFAMVMADLDHFKSINDRFGHHGGDAALTAFAQRLSAAVGSEGLCFRYGGEEFGVLLPDTNAAEALRLIERVRQEVALPAEGHRHALSASFGVATWQSGDTADTLLGRADQALYRAKAAGRNRAEVA